MIKQSWGQKSGAACHEGMDNKKFPGLSRLESLTTDPDPILTPKYLKMRPPLV